MKIARKNSILSKKKVILLVVLLVVLLSGTTYAYYRTTTTSDKNQESGFKNVDKDASNRTSNSGNDGTIASPRQDNTSEDQSPSQSTLDIKPTSPSGVFVSNHRPNISGNPAPSMISSTCTTSAGVDCFIEFRNGEVVKSLSRQKTDANGNTSWFWSISDIGLTQGTWTITAVAANGSLQVKSKDPMDLVVKE